MTETIWQPRPEELYDDHSLGQTVLRTHEEILREQLAGDPMLNRDLPVQLRALRHIETWRVLLLLTPWMLSRLLFPDDPLDLAIPPGWSAKERRNADYLVLGPKLELELLGQPQQAHLNYQRALGHYLLQPICLDMSPYTDADSVFEAWNQVIRTRDENMEKAKRNCPLQREISRRELFRRLRPPAES